MERNRIWKEISDESVHLMDRSGIGRDVMFKSFHDECSVLISQNRKCSANSLYVARGSGRIKYLHKGWFGPLYVACQYGHSDIAHRILIIDTCGCYLSIKEKGSLLSVACKNGHDKIVSLLLEYDVNVNCPNENGASPLYQACFNGHSITVQILLKSGAGVNLCTKNGTSPLFAACQNGHKNIVQILLSNGACINSCGDNRTTPLYIACQNGHENIVKLLLSCGADINLCNIRGYSPLDVASFIGYESITSLLKIYSGCEDKVKLVCSE